MTTAYRVSLPPHIRAVGSSAQMTWESVASLLPLIAVAVFFSGPSVIRVLGISVAASVLGGVCWQKIAGEKIRWADGRTVFLGLVFGLMLPGHLASGVVAVGACLSVFFSRGIFRGIGSELFNPVFAVWVLLKCAFPVAMAEPPLYVCGAPGLLACLVGATILIVRRLADWRVGIAYLLIAAGAVAFFPGVETIRLLVWILFPAFYLLSNAETIPLTSNGRLLFGVAVGLTALALSTRFSYLGSLSLATLAMNGLSPWIDFRIRPRGSYSIKGLEMKEGKKREAFWPEFPRVLFFGFFLLSLGAVIFLFRVYRQDPARFGRVFKKISASLQRERQAVKVVVEQKPIVLPRPPVTQAIPLQSIGAITEKAEASASLVPDAPSNPSKEPPKAEGLSPDAEKILKEIES